MSYRKPSKGDDLLEFATPAQALGYKRQSTLSVNSPVGTGSLSPANGLSPANTGGTPNGHSRKSSWNAANGIPAQNSGSTYGSSQYAQQHQLTQYQPEPQPQYQQQQQQQQQQPQQQQAINQGRRFPGPEGGPREQLKDQLRGVFEKCDADRNGRLTENELKHALLNYDQTEFNVSTVRQMIKSFDNTRSNSIDFEQFLALWDYLSRWKTVFDKFDADRSFSISFAEYSNALKALGFSIEHNCLQHIFGRFSYNLPNQGAAMKLDSFVESMVWIMQITEDFKKFPSRDNGNTAQVLFSGFLDVILRHRD